MLSYKKWKSLNESLGSFSLGMGNPQNMGVHGMLPKKKVDNDEEDFDNDEENLDDEHDDDVDDSDEDMDDSDSTDDVDSGEDENLGDVDDSEDGDEDENGDFNKKKKSLVGMPHSNSAFMKKESCKDDEDENSEEEGDEDEDEDEDSELKDKELAFMQKKGMKSGKKMKKKCSDGDDMPEKMCGKCKKMMKKKMKKECADVKTDSDSFIENLKKSYQQSVFKKFSDGLHEDMLIMLPETEPKPGDVGFAPDTRIGSIVTPQLAESINLLLKKVEDLEKKLGK